jgi:hypothetical protein
MHTYVTRGGGPLARGRGACQAGRASAIARQLFGALPHLRPSEQPPRPPQQQAMRASVTGAGACGVGDWEYMKRVLAVETAAAAAPATNHDASAGSQPRRACPVHPKHSCVAGPAWRSARAYHGRISAGEWPPLPVSVPCVARGAPVHGFRRTFVDLAGAAPPRWRGQAARWLSSS